MHLPPPEFAYWARLLSIPLIDAFVGWVTTFLAIRMIFRPRRALRLPGFTFQGLVPKRHGELAHSIGQTVEQHLISQADVLAILEREDIQHGLDAAIQERVRDFLDTKLNKINPMLGMMFSGSLREKVEALLVKEVGRMLPELSARMMETLEQNLNFQAIVEEKVRAFDLDQLEAIIYGIAHRELRAIELICGVLGFLIGLAQVGLLLLWGPVH